MTPPQAAVDRELVLLNPGPAGTSQRVKDALGRGDLCHREPEFSDLLARLREQIPQALNLPGTHESVLVTGSGTAAMEMAILACVRAGRAVLVINNGVYGQRLAAIARAHAITVYEVTPEGDDLARWVTPIDPQAVADALAAHDDIDAVVCVHHETTTGLMNPVAEIGRLVAGTDVVFVVDAISSAGNEAPDLSVIGADILCGSANKGLHALPGLAFLLCTAKGVQRLQEVPVRGLYLHAATYLAGQRRGEVPFTPAVQIHYALDEALAEYTEAGGYPARAELYRRRAALVRAGFTRLDLEPIVAPAHRAASVSTLPLPDGVTYRRLHDELKARGYVIYAGQGNLSARFFRICTLGEIAWHRLEALEPALGEAIHAAKGSAT